MSREAYEDMKAQRDRLQDRFDLLLEGYQALRMQGANPASPPPEKVTNDVVAQASIKRSFGSRALRKQYAELAALRRSQGVSEDEIAAEIMRGESGFDEEYETLGRSDVN